MTCMVIPMASSFLYSLRWLSPQKFYHSTMFPQRPVEVWADFASVQLQVPALWKLRRNESMASTGLPPQQLEKTSQPSTCNLCAPCFDCAVLLVSLALVKANVVGWLEHAAAPIPLSSVALAQDDFTRIFQRGYASMWKYMGKTLQTAWYCWWTKSCTTWDG